MRKNTIKMIESKCEYPECENKSVSIIRNKDLCGKHFKLFKLDNKKRMRKGIGTENNLELLRETYENMYGDEKEIYLNNIQGGKMEKRKKQLDKETLKRKEGELEYIGLQLDEAEMQLYTMELGYERKIPMRQLKVQIAQAKAQIENLKNAQTVVKKQVATGFEMEIVPEVQDTKEVE